MSEKKTVTPEKRPLVAPPSWSQESYWIGADASDWHASPVEPTANNSEELWLHRETDSSLVAQIQREKSAGGISR